MKSELFITLLHQIGKMIYLLNGPLIQPTELFKRQLIFRGIKITQIAQQITKRVPDFSIGFGQLFQDFFGKPDVILIITGRHPKAENVGAEFFHDILRRHDIAGRFRHFLSFPVYDKSMRQNTVKRRMAVKRDCGRQSALKPAPVLVRAFQI